MAKNPASSDTASEWKTEQSAGGARSTFLQKAPRPDAELSEWIRSAEPCAHLDPPDDWLSRVRVTLSTPLPGLTLFHSRSSCACLPRQ